MQIGRGIARKCRVATAAAAASALLSPTPAYAKSNAGGLLIILQNASVVITGASRCVTFTYDKNGNRITQATAAPPASSPTWGSSSYGCFAWHN